MLLASTATPLMSGRKSLITVRQGEQLMLDTQNQSPQCMDCDSPMTLTAIEPGGLGQDLRAFTCEKCKRVERHIIESAVTEE
jgi:Zn finger protein HypA/HybF involved in hydrogenase expression